MVATPIRQRRAVHRRQRHPDRRLSSSRRPPLLTRALRLGSMCLMLDSRRQGRHGHQGRAGLADPATIPMAGIRVVRTVQPDRRHAPTEARRPNGLQVATTTAALGARRNGITPGNNVTTSSGQGRGRSRHPAQGARIFVAGLSVTSILGLTAAYGATANDRGAAQAMPAPVSPTRKGAELRESTPTAPPSPGAISGQPTAAPTQAARDSSLAVRAKSAAPNGPVGASPRPPSSASQPPRRPTSAPRPQRPPVSTPAHSSPPVSSPGRGSSGAGSGSGSGSSGGSGGSNSGSPGHTNSGAS